MGVGGGVVPDGMASQVLGSLVLFLFFLLEFMKNITPLYIYLKKISLLETTGNTFDDLSTTIVEVAQSFPNKFVLWEICQSLPNRLLPKVSQI